MENKNNQNFNQVALALLAGAAIGAILGVLFAPAKGTETRGRVKDAFKGLSDEMKEKFNEGTSNGSDKQS